MIPVLIFVPHIVVGAVSLTAGFFTGRWYQSLPKGTIKKVKPAKSLVSHVEEVVRPHKARKSNKNREPATS